MRRIIDRTLVFVTQLGFLAAAISASVGLKW